ncbi:MAG: hypothetical protein DLM53_06250 [Candidatus Eremiobacter antarcticus]|nr:DNA-3-methyladenine glycosylase I [Candidatus Eremiobacteraeota bacterium]MBC5807108.1 DNA-3-methyladenine glycosylase I [Candidatus Eremiobacteraeota bacterium]PZR62414.1 MAG: hypothetical protein DLM53_06250 [Candidatus Eremiobacter sp. RRmetagenome_bin22]
MKRKPRKRKRAPSKPEPAASPAALHPRIEPRSLADYLKVMSRAVFQAGLSWAQINAQWEGMCEAFDQFEPAVVARYKHKDVRRILATPGVVHSERKVQATIHNTRTLQALEREHGSVRKYLRSFRSYQDLSADLQERFSHIGEISAYYFVFRVGETVPPFGRWVKTVKGDHPRIREMVKLFSKQNEAVMETMPESSRSA